MTNEFIADDGSIIPSKRCKRCEKRKILACFPFRAANGKEKAHHENVCKDCRRERDAIRRPPKRKEPIRRPYQRNDAPDPLNAVSREWKGPTSGRLQVRI